MIKKAFFMEGKPNSEDDFEKYTKSFHRDLQIMEDIARDNEYSIKKIYSGNLEDLNSYSGGDFLFYYVGHASNGAFEKNNVEQIFSKLQNKKGNKKIILDACAGGDNIENILLPEGVQIITANEVPINKSIAMMLWDHVYAYKKDFEKINKDDFEKMKHNWIYYRTNLQ